MKSKKIEAGLYKIPLFKILDLFLESKNHLKVESDDFLNFTQGFPFLKKISLNIFYILHAWYHKTKLDFLKFVSLSFYFLHNHILDSTHAWQTKKKEISSLFQKFPLCAKFFKKIMSYISQFQRSALNDKLIWAYMV